MTRRPGRTSGQGAGAVPSPHASARAAIDCLERLPSIAEYNALRRLAGWHTLADEAAAAALAHSLYGACLCLGDEVIGCGRVVGDGGAYFYVQDVIVHPKYRGQGLARRIMDSLMAYIDAAAPQGAFIGLMTASGLETFYAHYGFRPLPDDSPGLGFWR